MDGSFLTPQFYAEFPRNRDRGAVGEGEAVN